MKVQKLIPHNWDVPEEFRSRLGDRPGRQRLFTADGHLLIVAHAPPNPDEPTRQARLFWRKPDGEWMSTANGNGLVALNSHLEEFGKVVDRCDQLEDVAQTAQEYFDVLDKIAPLKRTIGHLNQVLEEARRLFPKDRDIINLRDQAYDISRTSELLYDATHNAMEMMQTRRAEQQATASLDMAAASHRLNWLVALFLPLATLSGVFGMSLNSTFESFAAPWPFVGVCVAGLILGLVLSGLVMKKS